MTPILGIMASGMSGNLWAPGKDFDSIATGTGTGSSGTISFTSIPQTYRHLQIRWMGRGSSADNNIDMYCWLNGNTSQANYTKHALRGNGATATASGSAASAQPIMGNPTAANLNADMMGVGIIDILDYRDTNKYKTQRAITGEDENGAGNVWLFSSVFMNSSAVTQIDLQTQTGNWTTDSTFALYGVK